MRAEATYDGISTSKQNSGETRVPPFYSPDALTGTGAAYPRLLTSQEDNPRPRAPCSLAQEPESESESLDPAANLQED